MAAPRPCRTAPGPRRSPSELVVAGARRPSASCRGRRRRRLVVRGPPRGGRPHRRRPPRRRRRASPRSLPDGRWNARTRVHEYGGGAWWVRDGVAVVRRLGRPAPLPGRRRAASRCAAHARARACRAACATPTATSAPTARRSLCVRERAPRRRHARRSTTIVRLPAAGEPSEPDGASSPGPTSCPTPAGGPTAPASAGSSGTTRTCRGTRTAPRSSTRSAARDALVAGGARGSRSCQPDWAPDGSLLVHRPTAPAGGTSTAGRPSRRASSRMVDLERRDRRARSGCSASPATPSSTTAASPSRYGDDGLDRLAVRRARRLGRVDARRRRTRVIDGLPADGDHGASSSPPAADRRRPHVVAVDLGAGGAASSVVRAAARDLGLDPAWFSRARADRRSRPPAAPTAHALYYPPTNPDVAGPAGERPPLLVLIHGGPTSAARPMLEPRHASSGRAAGFAVVDVNYRGSHRLRPRRTATCSTGSGASSTSRTASPRADHLVERGRRRPRPAVPSAAAAAGGFTTLAALTFHDAFAAGASHYGVADLEALARDTHKFESRYLDGLVGPYPRRRAVYVARSPIHHTDELRPPAHRVPGPRGRGRAAEPGRDDRRRARGPRACPSPTCPSRASSTGSARPQNICAALEAELWFYGQVFGFDPADADRAGRTAPSVST